MATMTRRLFCQSLGGSSLIVPSLSSMNVGAPPQSPGAAADAPHIGNLYPFVQKQADRSPLELSFLHPRFKDLKSWQKIARARVFDCLDYSPPPAVPAPSVLPSTFPVCIGISICPISRRSSHRDRYSSSTAPATRSFRQMASRRHIARLRHAFERSASRRSSVAGSTTRRTSSTARCRLTRGSGSAVGCD